MPDTVPTELDKALMLVQENPDEVHVFYNTFLNSVLYLPTHDAPESNREGVASSGKELRPIFTQSGETIFLMLFDSLDRLSAWAEKDMGYVGLEGHALLDIMDPKFHWYLNYGTEYGHEFGSDEIRWLKSAVQRAATHKTHTLEEDTEVLTGKPKEVPDGLIEALEQVAEHYAAIELASLGQMFIVGKMNHPELALAIRYDEIPDEMREKILSDFTTAARSIIDDAEEFWILSSGESSHADSLLNGVAPFYKR